MNKNATYKEKFNYLKEWIPTLINTIKKDLKNEHLKKDYQFMKTYLPSKNINKVTTEDLIEAYTKAIEGENGENIAEFLASRWLINHSELYDYFDQYLSSIYPDFTTLEVIDLNTAETLLSESHSRFGLLNTYIFSVLNSVVFPEKIFKELAQKAKNHRDAEEKETFEISEKLNLEKMRASYTAEIARLTDKYEKKLAGLQKKYIADTEGLKKQLAQLQRKLKV